MHRTQNDSPAWADVPWWALALIFAPVYLFAILVGYAFFLTPNSISALWPASGEALIDDLAKARPNLPVVVVSGYSSSENADLPPEVLFVPKPFSTKMLLACVRQALDAR